MHNKEDDLFPYVRISYIFDIFNNQLKKRVTGHTRVLAMPSKSRHNNAICWRHLKVPITSLSLSLSPIPSLNTHFNFQLRSHAVSDFTWFNKGGISETHLALESTRPTFHTSSLQVILGTKAGFYLPRQSKSWRLKKQISCGSKSK